MRIVYLEVADRLVQTTVQQGSARMFVYSQEVPLCIETWLFFVGSGFDCADDCLGSFGNERIEEFLSVFHFQSVSFMFYSIINFIYMRAHHLTISNTKQHKKRSKQNKSSKN